MSKIYTGDNSVLFIKNDGLSACEMKEFLIKQNRCKNIKIDNETFYCKRYYKKES